MRADYLIRHYWDHFNFADSNYIHHPEVAEQAWADYLGIMDHVSVETAGEVIRETLTKAEGEKKLYNYFIGLAEKYLYAPYSPLKNEEYYIPVLEHAIASDALGADEKIRPRMLLELVKKNRAGTKAIDFAYTLESGKKGALHKISSDYTLIFFYDPDCRTCHDILNKMKFSIHILRAVEEKRMTILCMYTEEELDEWRKHTTDIPKEWINAYDKKHVIMDKNLYDLKAIPTLYLLDKEKKVLLKDTTVEGIEEMLRR